MVSTACSAGINLATSAPVINILPTDVPAATATIPRALGQEPVASPTTAPPDLAPTVTSPSTYQPIAWKDLVSFLEKDHTNWNVYNAKKYNCVDFSVDLAASAEKQNIKAWIVLTEFTNGGPGHAFVAFKTSDLGVIYVEPQADDTYPIVEVGKPLCDSWGVFQCMGTISTIQTVQCDHNHDCTLYIP
jgi:hypothetical protein